MVEEAVSNRLAVFEGVPRSLPGTLFCAGGAGLGYGLGAALGVALSAPGREVVALVGDGSYVFGNPTAAFWAALRALVGAGPPAPVSFPSVRFVGPAESPGRSPAAHPRIAARVPVPTV